MILIILGIVIPILLYLMLQLYVKFNFYQIAHKFNYSEWRIECLFVIMGFPLLLISVGVFGFHINAIPPVEGFAFSFFYPLIIIFLRPNVFDVISATWNEDSFPLLFMILSFVCSVVWFVVGFSEIFTNEYAIAYILIGCLMGFIPLIPDVYDKIFHLLGTEYNQDDFELNVAVLLLTIITFFAAIICYVLLCPVLHVFN